MRLARATASAVAVMLAAITVPAFAEDICSDEAVWTGSCGPSSTLTEDLMRRRVDRTLATDPAKDRVHRLNGSGTVPGVTPFAMTPDGDNTNFNTSLTQWGSSLSAADKAALEQAKTKFGDELTLPKPAEPVEPDFDIWAKGRRELFSEEGDIAKQGNALTTFVGADYRVRKEFLVGGMVQVDESRQTVLAAPDAVDGTAYKIGRAHV